MADDPGLSPVHRIISTFSRAVEALGLGVPPLFIEKWAVAVHQALSSRAREFHTHQHVLDLVRGADAIETLAALYHDIVYVQVDLDVPSHYAGLLQPLVARDSSTPHGWRLLPHTEEDPTARDVMHVFGRKAGEVLTPFTGLNELASGFVAAKELEGVLSREQLIAVVTCIEASIPFRDGEAVALRDRLTTLGLQAEEIGVMVRRATRLSNNDVGNFADPDPARFLDNTWKLLPETNPSLHAPTTYSIKDYRVALMKMERFLSALPPSRVFHTWGGEPSQQEHEHRIAAAARNIDIAVRYMRCKLYSSSLLEALALESGGDVPLPYFLGGVPDGSGVPMKRLEQFLPAPEPTKEGTLDGIMRGLLLGGRTTSSSFDIAPSPVADFLYVALGEERLLLGFKQAQRMWDGVISPREFLSIQPLDQLEVLAWAVAEMAPTRAIALVELMKLL
ncbi:MAG: hypothetical protein DI536_32280 [Archangium gephyra]|uniref:Uncharacterized protein n=1 Tax=Archangium gephyra TaxID=48 RepID=A0A2W5SX58_9BACT|nr:MAG: hypothetical protein DI536_32280 [Archangium gephyra]